MNSPYQVRLRLPVRAFCAVALLGALQTAGCASGEFPALPGIPDELRAVPNALQGLELPELSGVALPGTEQLSDLQPPDGALLLVGPTAPTVAAGTRLPGTDVIYLGMEGEDAVFEIAGMHSQRRMGDAVDFSGAWPGLPGSIYQVRTRIYGYTADAVWLAGVQQLLVPAVLPARGAPAPGTVTLRFPFVDGVQADGVDTIAGTTFGYMGKYERGAQLSGVPDGEYPYRAVGDSIVWEGTLRPDVGAAYDLRTLAYGRDSLRVGGTVAVTLPMQ